MDDASASEDAGVDRFSPLKAWADALGIADWNSFVTRTLGIKNPRLVKQRLRNGEAPRQRALLFEELKKREERRKGGNTDVGACMLGLDEWMKLGERLAATDPKAFLTKLEQLRQVVAGAEADRAFQTVK